MLLKEGQMRRAHLFIPSQLLEEVEQRADKLGVTTSKLVRALCVLKIEVDASRSSISEGEQYPISVGDQPVDPEIASNKHPMGRGTSRFHLATNRKEFQQVKLAAETQGLTTSQFVRGALAFGVEAYDLAESLNAFPYPLGLPLNIGGKRIALVI